MKDFSPPGVDELLASESDKIGGCRKRTKLTQFGRRRVLVKEFEKMKKRRKRKKNKLQNEKEKKVAPVQLFFHNPPYPHELSGYTKHIKPFNSWAFLMIKSFSFARNTFRFSHRDFWFFKWRRRRVRGRRGNLTVRHFSIFLYFLSPPTRNDKKIPSDIYAQISVYRENDIRWCLRRLTNIGLVGKLLRFGLWAGNIRKTPVADLTKPKMCWKTWKMRY